MYWNGYSGLNCNDAFNLDYIGNTAYMNSYTDSVYNPMIKGDGIKTRGSRIGISFNDGAGHRMYNNICVSDTEVQGPCYGFFREAKVEASNNLQFGSGKLPFKFDDRKSFSYMTVAKNAVTADPMFEDPENANFHLQEDSPAREFALPVWAHISDIDYYMIPRDPLHPDLGAIESKNVA